MATRPRKRSTTARSSATSRALAACVNVGDLETLARTRLTRGAYDYYAGGAEDERTVLRNREAFGRWLFVPRALAGTGTVTLATTVLGTPVASPVLIAPAAYHKLAHPDGERATARAAAAAGSLIVLSTMSTVSLEDVAASANGPKWFQLYVYKDRSLTERLIARAEAAGYGALVLTVDTPRLGRRERDARNGFALPKGMPLANFTREDPRLATWKAFGSMAAYANAQLDPTLGWEAVAWLQRATRLPLVLKGVMHPDDAVSGIDAGASAIWVSNHGGRQLDSSLSTIEALGPVASALAGRAEVYADGGVRRGTDVLKALSLGARAVFVGRPSLWGLAAGGEAGVRRVLEMLNTELETAMAIAGVREVEAARTASIVRESDPPPRP